jgi:hypothetical protein
MTLTGGSMASVARGRGFDLSVGMREGVCGEGLGCWAGMLQWAMDAVLGQREGEKEQRL